MMEALIENDGFKKIVNKWKQSFYYGKIKVKMNLIKFLKNIGLYKVIKRIIKGDNTYDISCDASLQCLDEAIQSILTQTYKDFEFIIINDGSTDKSLEIIEKYKKE